MLLTESFSSDMIIDLSLALAFFGLFACILTDHFQIIVKYNGSKNKRVAFGYNRAMKVMVFNRMGAVIFFLFVAFSIDRGTGPNLLINGFSIILFILCIPTFLFYRLIHRDIKENSPTTEKLNNISIFIIINSFFATILNILGLTMPWIAAAIYSEFRLTLANTSFLFNTFYTLLNVFYIEHRLASYIDTASDEIVRFVTYVIIGRFLALLLMSIVLFFLGGTFLFV